MPRPPRTDYPGALHHVMNRALGRRTAFETRDDVRFFLSRLGYAVRRGEIQVAAYSVLNTHYHLLVRSPKLKLSEAMRRVQNEYVRAFNRKRKRDGPLFRGRFISRLVESEQYLLTVIHYIDQNAAQTRLAASPEPYPYGSAFHYARTAGPPWLDRGLVERLIDARGAAHSFEPGDYERAFGSPLSEGQERLVESRLAFQHPGADPLDDLIGAAPTAVRRWMSARAVLADGTPPGLPIACPVVTMECIADIRTPPGAWRVMRSRKTVDLWDVVCVAMLRHACSLTIEDTAQRVRISRATVRGYLEMHRDRLPGDEVYASCAATALARILERTFPARINREPRDSDLRGAILAPGNA